MAIEKQDLIDARRMEIGGLPKKAKIKPFSWLEYDLGNHKDIFINGPVIKSLQLEPARYGYLSGTKYQAEMVFAPIAKPEGFMIMTALKISRPKENKRDLTKLPTSIVFISGGGSQAPATTAEACRISDTFFNDPNNNITEIIALSHPFGAAQTPDTFNQQNMNIAVNAAATILQLPELNLNKNVVLIGFSAGGWLSTELAAHKDFQNKIKALVLIDPAGIVNTPHILWNLLADQFKQYFSKHSTDTLDKMIREGMMNSEGIPPNILTVMYNIIFGDIFNQSLAKYLNLKREAVADFQKVYGNNSTKPARDQITQPIILVPVVGAEVANILKSYGFSSENIKQNINNASTLENRYINFLRSLFPKIDQEKLHVLLDQGFIHNGPLKKLDIWEKIKAAVLQYIK